MADWIIVVDDNTANLKEADQILSGHGMRVTTLTSGKALLELVEKQTPDLILMDIQMPGMDGFEIMRRLKSSPFPAVPEIPVIFLTCQENQTYETHGLQLGAMDFLHMPVNPEVLVSRVQKTLLTQRRLLHFEHAAATDNLTSFMNKNASAARMEYLCAHETGMLCILDLDSFKLVNDLYGHDIGDQVLSMFARHLRNIMRAEDECGRIGGDEFIIFARNMRSEHELQLLTQRINSEFLEDAKNILGAHMTLPLGVSIGAASVPDQGRDYKHLFHLADQALHQVKHQGKHCVRLSRHGSSEDPELPGLTDLEMATSILEERNITPAAMWMGREAFISIYRYMVRYMERYHGSAYRVLFTLSIVPEVTDEMEQREIMNHFREKVQHSLRNSDVMMDVGENKLFLLLPEAHDYDIDRVIARLLGAWERSPHARLTRISYESGRVQLNHEKETDVPGERLSRIAMVSGNVEDMEKAKALLEQQHILASCLTSGQELLRSVSSSRPDLILLDVSLPDIDGFEVMHCLKETLREEQDIPVIFLCSDNTQESEILGLQLGAVDFIRKPFVPEALVLRVQHTLELNLLQRSLAAEAEKRAQENESLSTRVVHALATAIDAKDAYTNGHSARVATYARDIARRFGYTEKQQNDIFMMGILHDVGKIGIPDAVINKPDRLTEEEYALIKNHPVMGARILERIHEMPLLAIGARFHHERYDGLGYPDGLAGEAIPEEARILAVADAYDAMSSRRSYRNALSQEAIRQEILEGRGTQFDPRFADIMLNIISEDVHFKMRE